MTAHKIKGNKTLAELTQFCHSRLARLSLRIVVIQFPVVSEATQQQLWSSTISCRAKKRAFEQAGFQVEWKQLSETEDLHRFVDLLVGLDQNAEIVGVIIQRPVPSRFRSVLASGVPTCDLDACSRTFPNHKGCAAAEAAIRLILHFSGLINEVAVIGGLGYVGNAVVQCLQDLCIPYLIIDKGHPLREVHSSPVVVSATGQPHLLTRQHISETQRLLIDVGFTPLSLNPLVVYGDIHPDAYPSSGIVTPVPGGVGPFQIAVLLARAAHLAGLKELPEWNLEPG